MNGYAPPVPAAGVPASVAVPSPLSTNVTPVGSAPVSDKTQGGTPLVVTVKVPTKPTVKVAPTELVIVHVIGWTVRTKGWVAAGMAPFVAVIVNGYVPPEPVGGVPASVAVPPPLSVNVSHGGSVPVSVNEHVLGTPVVVTVKVPAWPTVKVVPARLVIWHAWLTVRVKLWVALKGAIRLRAVIVNVYVPWCP